MPTLIYIHDPMCSWCWGFRPTLHALLDGLPPDIRVQRLLGGLAPDSAEPMPTAMRAQLQHTWRQIQQRIPGTRFNFDFWTRCAPRRSTFPACRAVIAARLQATELDQAMTEAIQRAYYLEARNPSDRDTLIALATEIGADADRFAHALDAPDTQRTLDAEMTRARAMGISAFPSLVLHHKGRQAPIAVDYTNPSAMLSPIRAAP